MHAPIIALGFQHCNSVVQYLLVFLLLDCFDLSLVLILSLVVLVQQFLYFLLVLRLHGTQFLLKFSLHLHPYFSLEFRNDFFKELTNLVLLHLR